MNTQITVALATLPTAAALFLMVGRARAWWHPTGQHRDPGQVALADSAALGDPGDFAWCPACTRTTYHALPGDNTRRCWTCNTTTEEGQ